MTRDFIKKLEGIDLSSPRCTVDMKGIVSKYNDSLIQELKTIIEDTTRDKKLRFVAYYSLSIIYRDGGQYDHYCKHVYHYNNWFTEYPLNNIAISHYYKYSISISSRTDYDSLHFLAEALRYAEIAKTDISYIFGVNNTYASLIVWAKERSLPVSVQDIENGIKAVDKELELKWNNTTSLLLKGRLLYYSGDHSGKAISFIERAIEVEQNNKEKSSDFFIIECYSHMAEIRSAKAVDDLSDQFEKYKEKLTQYDEERENKYLKIMDQVDKQKVNFIEILGFFAAILAFIMTSVNIAIKGYSFLQTAALLIILSGSLTLAFVLFRYLIDYQAESKPLLTLKSIFIVLFSIAIIAVGILLGACENELSNIL